MTATTPRVEVELKATGTCYLSNEPPFYLVLHSGLCNSEERMIFLQDGFAGAGGYQPINSNQIIQCFDKETGEQVQVLHQGTQPVFLDRSYIQFTTSKTRQSYELPFITSALRPGRKYRLRFKPTTSISHWPASAENALNSLARAPSGSVSALDNLTPSRQTIPWEAADGNDTIVFETRSSRPSTPKVTVSLSAPSTYSLSKPFAFTLTFSTDAAYPITVLAHRARVKSEYSDVKILDATSRVQLAPDLIVCRDEDEHQREEFLRLEGTYTEHRELDFGGPIWEELELEVGKEYILSHLGGKWWWTEDTVDEIMDYLDSWSNAGLEMAEGIEFAGADEVKFKVVE
jgi:hypothetical protein